MREFGVVLEVIRHRRESIGDRTREDESKSQQEDETSHQVIEKRFGKYSSHTNEEDGNGGLTGNVPAGRSKENVCLKISTLIQS